MTIFQQIEEINIGRILGANVSQLDRHLLKGEITLEPHPDEYLACRHGRVQYRVPSGIVAAVNQHPRKDNQWHSYAATAAGA